MVRTQSPGPGKAKIEDLHGLLSRLSGYDGVRAGKRNIFAVNFEVHGCDLSMACGYQSLFVNVVLEI